ncbi:MAG: threonylcarbamoyl-AMP synthase [Lentisphaerae bacterium]|nr:threonylcarbamoyl-AMP synthase [Lentisphaerota bacterium]
MSRPLIVSASGESAEQAVRQAVDVLRQGCLVVMPTDTVYGLAADPRVPGAEAALYAAKGRPEGKPVALLAGDSAQVEAMGAALEPAERELARRFWPGPLTLVLRMRTGREEGVRVPGHVLALALLKAVGAPLRVTSANVSGKPPALTAADAVRALGAAVGLGLDAGPAPGGVPSTVLRVRGKMATILREGAISAADIANVLSPFEIRCV